MNINDALTYGRSMLADSASPYLDARLLLEDTTKLNHVQIVANPELELELEQEHCFRQKIQRAAVGEPIPYITGRTNFAGLELIVSPVVLIPRQETEFLAAAALDWVRNGLSERSSVNIADVGTGSGCIAIYLAKNLESATIEAVDLSEDALKVAQMNAERHSVSARIVFYQGNLLDPIQLKPHLIIANLPYVADHEWSVLSDSVKWYEPPQALQGGKNGLEVISKLLVDARKVLAPGGAIYLEIGWQQGKRAQKLAKEFFPEASIKVSADFSGNDRVLSVLS